jgi:hypothetical protein
MNVVRTLHKAFCWLICAGFLIYGSYLQDGGDELRAFFAYLTGILMAIELRGEK